MHIQSASVGHRRMLSSCRNSLSSFIYVLCGATAGHCTVHVQLSNKGISILKRFVAQITHCQSWSVII